MLIHQVKDPLKNFEEVWIVNKLSDLWHTDVPWVNAPDWSHPSCKQPFVGPPSVSSRKWPTKINKMEWSINRFIASEIDKNEMERPEMTGCLIVELVLDFSWLLRTSCYPHFPTSTKVRNKAAKTTVQLIWLIRPSETKVCMPRTNFGTKNIVLSKSVYSRIPSGHLHIKYHDTPTINRKLLITTLTNSVDYHLCGRSMTTVFYLSRDISNQA